MQKKQQSSDIFDLQSFKRASYWAVVAFGFLLVGVIGNILERGIGFALGLEANSWYLISIALLLTSVFHFIIWAVDTIKQ